MIKEQQLSERHFPTFKQTGGGGDCGEGGNELYFPTVKREIGREGHGDMFPAIKRELGRWLGVEE